MASASFAFSLSVLVVISADDLLMALANPSMGAAISNPGADEMPTPAVVDAGVVASAVGAWRGMSVLAPKLTWALIFSVRILSITVW